MSFVDTFFQQLQARANDPLIIEVFPEDQGGHTPTTGAQLAQHVASMRAHLRALGLAVGDRVAVLAPNSALWAAADLALLAEGLISVPLYTRQAPRELAGMVRDCGAQHLLVDTEDTATALLKQLSIPVHPFAAWLTPPASGPVHAPPHRWQPDDTVSLVYTSGTSGEPKGAQIAVKGVDHMLPVTAQKLSALVSDLGGDERVFHYLPLCFAGSRIVLWTCLSRGAPLWLSTSLDRLIAEIPSAAPHYFLNVPTLLERVRAGAEAKLRGQGAVIAALYDAAVAAYAAQSAQTGSVTGAHLRHRAVLALADRVLFGRVRAALGPNLRFLICGSAPLSAATQAWYGMLGVAVYQVYGLTETTAILTMDKVGVSEPGRVGYAIDGVQLRLGEGDELQAKGANIFTGYHNRPEASAEAFTQDGWFRTGDQCSLREDGSLKVIGRVKHLLVPASGHNVPPEPIEAKLMEAVRGLNRVVMVGHGRPHLAALFDAPDTVTDAQIEAGVAEVNDALPFYKRVRAWRRLPEPLEGQDTLVTANGKLRRKAIDAHHIDLIDAMYA